MKNISLYVKNGIVENDTLKEIISIASSLGQKLNIQNPCVFRPEDQVVRGVDTVLLPKKDFHDIEKIYLDSDVPVVTYDLKTLESMDKAKKLLSSLEKKEKE